MTPAGTIVFARYLPGAVFLSYLAGTAILFFTGPWEFPIEDPVPLIVFLVLAHLALALGYLAGVRGAPRAASRPLDVRRAAAVCIACDLALLFPTSALNTGSWIPNPFAAIQDLGGAYLRSLELRLLGVPWVNYVRILAAPLLAAVIPLGVFYWGRLSRVTRLMFGASIVGMLALFTAMGANAGAAHWMMLFPWFVVAAHLSGENRLGRWGWTGAASVQIASVALFAVFFTASMNARVGSFAVHGYMPGIDAVVEPIAGGKPSERGALEVGRDGFAAYLSHGYYGLYLSLQEPFVPMYGIGNSVFLQRQAARLLGDSTILERPYPKRIEPNGWKAEIYFATIYPWLASDVGFAGTIVVMGLVGLAFGAVWRDVLGGRNPWAVLFFGQMLMLLYYVPAHNKVMHAGEGVVAFWTLLGLWLFSRSGRRTGTGRSGAAGQSHA